MLFRCGETHLAVVLLHAPRAHVKELADGGLRVHVAHVGGVLKVLHHLLLAARVVAGIVVHAQPYALDAGERPRVARPLHHLGQSSCTNYTTLTQL